MRISSPRGLFLWYNGAMNSHHTHPAHHADWCILVDLTNAIGRPSVTLTFSAGNPSSDSTDTWVCHSVTTSNTPDQCHAVLTELLGFQPVGELLPGISADTASVRHYKRSEQ